MWSRCLEVVRVPWVARSLFILMLHIPWPMSSSSCAVMLFLPPPICVFCLEKDFLAAWLTCLYCILRGLMGFGRTWAVAPWDPPQKRRRA
eukprot:9498391-Pyramimonas_sp.AAC.2